MQGLYPNGIANDAAKGSHKYQAIRHATTLDLNMLRMQAKIQRKKPGKPLLDISKSLQARQKTILGNNDTHKAQASNTF